MFNLVNRCSSFVASVAGNVIAAGSEAIDDESSRDSGVSDLGVASGSTASTSTTTSTTTTTTTGLATSFSTQTSSESQQSVIFQDFEKEFVRPSRWTTSSESSEDYQDRMSLVGDEQLTHQPPQATPTGLPMESRSRDPSSGSLSASAGDLPTSFSSSANALNRKRSAPALASEFSPLHKTVKSNSSLQSDQASSSVLRDSNALVTTPETHATDEVTTPTFRRPTLRKYESLRTNMLKQRSECMKSPELLKAKDKSDENFDLGDDDVFFAENEDDFVLQDGEINENEQLKSMSVEISPIHPVDRFNEDNASFAARRRSLLEGSTPTRRYNSAFEPSDSSTPAGSRFRRMPLKLDSSGDEGDGHDVGAPTVFSPLPKSTSMNDLSMIEKSHINHYHLPATSEDKATVERCPISIETLRDTLVRLSDEEFKKKYILIDARYPYEYRGGHVRHAINCHLPEKIADVFFNPETFDEIKTKIPIFYCEFSQARGPNMVRALRQLDRQRNIKEYPKLDYPELYLLYGGYRAFYNEFRKQGFCVPDHYTKMMSKRYTAELKKYDSHKTTHEKGKSKWKKATWHSKQKELRQTCIFSSSDERPSSSKKTASKFTGNGLVDAEFNREIAKSEFLSTSSSRRYHAFDSSPDNSTMEDNFFSFSPRVRNGATRQNEDIFEERQPEPVQVEPQYQMPGPSEPKPVNGNVIRPKSVAELTDMVLAMSTKKAAPTRRPSAGPSKQPQGGGDGGHMKPVVDETTVAFGRTTKLKDTIQGVKPVAHGPVRPLVGTAKEVENLKKTVESQQSKLDDHETEIAALKATCENHRSEYVELLNTVDSMMLRMSTMEKKMASMITSSGSDAKNTAFNDAPSTSAKPRKAIMDSVALVKGNNYEEVRIKHRETDRTWDDPDRIRENARTPPPIAATQRARELQSDRRKRKDNLNRTIEGRPDERLNQTARDDRYQDQENRYRGHKNAYHDEYEQESDSQPISGRYKEKVTYRREYMYSPGRNADRPVLSTTIESTLTRDGPHRPRQQNPKCPQIEEPSDSEDETGYSDDYQGYGGGGHNAVSGIYKAPPAAPQRRYNDDGHGDIQYTVMPDVFEDELDSEEEPAPVPKEQHRVRQKVADRLARNGRN